MSRINSLVENWMLADRRAAAAHAAVAEAEAARDRTMRDLATFITPSDMTPGEKIAVWVRLNRHEETLVEVTLLKPAPGDSPIYRLNIRDRRDTPKYTHAEDGNAVPNNPPGLYKAGATGGKTFGT